MGQKWRKIRRRCSSFNTGLGKSRADDRGPCGEYDGDQRDRGPLLPRPPPLSDDSPPPSAAATVHDVLRARLNALNIGSNKRGPRHRGGHRTADGSSCTFYVPSPLLRTDGRRSDGDDEPAAGHCSLPVAPDLSAADHRLLRASSLCRAAAVQTPSSCGSSGRGTADDGAGSDRSSVSYSDHGYHSIASALAVTANGCDAALAERSVVSRARILWQNFQGSVIER